MEKDIYNLKLHETLEFRESEMIIKVMRVAGGWNYLYFNNIGHVIGTVNIPFDNEFQGKAKTLGELFTPDPKPKFNFKKSLIELGVSEQVASDWLKVRAKKKAANTETSFSSIKSQIKITTHNPDDCIKLAVIKNWSGFKAEWYHNEINKSTNTQNEQPKKLQSKF